MFGWSAAAISFSGSPDAHIGHHMLLCPVQNQTSPTITSSRTTDDAPSSALTVKGPPASAAGSSADHAPFASAVAVADAPRKETFTVRPGAAKPESRTGSPRCSTMWEEYMRLKRSGASAPSAR